MPATTPARSAYRSSARLNLLAATLIVFGASGLAAAEIIVPMLRHKPAPSAVPQRMVISYKRPGYVTKLTAQPQETAASYGCGAVWAVGGLTIGRSCLTRVAAVSH